MPPFAKWLIVTGALLIGAGLLFWLGGRVGLGRLPGDFLWKGRRTTVYFPLATSILISILLTLFLNFWSGRK